VCNIYVYVAFCVHFMFLGHTSGKLVLDHAAFQEKVSSLDDTDDIDTSADMSVDV